MGRSGENEVGPQAWERPRFVADLARCLADWERALSPGSPARDSGFSALLEQSRGLCERSKTMGFGGVGLHLGELVQRGPGDPGPAREQLGVVREMLESARRSLTPEEAGWDAAANTGPAIAVVVDALAPPPMLSMVLQSPLASAAPAAPPPPLEPPALAPPQPASFAPVAPSPALAPPRSLFESQMVKAPGGLAQSSPSPPPALQAPPPFQAPPAPPQSPPPAFQSPPAPVAQPAPGPRPGQPNLMVRSVLGLRGFGKGQAPQAAPTPAAAPLPALGQPSSVLGLKRPSTPAPAFEPGSPPAPPPSVGLGYGGLPSVERESSRAPSNFPPASRHTSSSPRAEARRSSAPEGPARRPRRRFEQGQSGGKGWLGIAAGFGVVVVGVVVFIVITVTRRSDPSGATGSATSASAATDSSAAPGSDDGMPRSRLLTENERFKAMLSQVHGRGGKESPELRALIDEHAALAAEAVSTKGCVGPNCKALTEIGKVVTGGPKLRVKRRSRSPDALRSKWLAGLKMPEIAVEDDPRVQRSFEFYTENPQGRETFQQMLFRCGEYQDQIQSALIRHGMPQDLIAVAFAESSCYPLAKSPVGAEGLWQFIPEAARAYHLRIIPDQVDERHSPQKSTDAAIKFLKDMHEKFNDWDLVFAGYNCGPFGLAARLERVEGENVGFWELVDADLLPDETANYAPAIQAIALILNNLQKLKFAGVQRRAPRMTMDLTVPPSTRLSLVAKAAAMSLQDLMRLNLDLKGTTTPALKNFAVQVPKDNVWQARDSLQELLKSGDMSDQCVPANFDWGRQRFTPEMAEACARTQSAQAPKK